MVMMVVRALRLRGLRAGLRLARGCDPVVLENLLHGALDHGVEIRGVAGLLGILDGTGDGRGKLILQAGPAAAVRAGTGSGGGLVAVPEAADDCEAFARGIGTDCNPDY